MTFTYPAVITPHKDDDGFHIVFPDLELCEGDGPDLEDALDDAREAAYNWLMLELEEGGEFPHRAMRKILKFRRADLYAALLCGSNCCRTATDQNKTGRAACKSHSQFYAGYNRRS